MSKPPAEASLGGWLAGDSRAQLSEGLVMLPKPGLQELIRQVVSCDDPHDLGQGENTQVTRVSSPPVRVGVRRTVPAMYPRM